MKIFLSSTFRDLQAHRRAVIESLQCVGNEVLCMEFFGARPEEPTVACTKEISGCEAFVGLYAHRYGHVPPGSQISITEAEYRHAKLNRIPVFGFLIDEEHPWPPKLIEPDPGQSKLQEFKNELRLDLVADTFSSPEDLATRVTASIARFQHHIRPNGRLDATLSSLSQQLARPSESDAEMLANEEFRRDVVFLLEAVLACHAAYKDYRADRSNDRLLKWRRRVEQLVVILDRISRPLAMHWPEAFRMAHGYAYYEALPAEEEMRRHRVARSMTRVFESHNGLQLLAEMAPLADLEDPTIETVLLCDESEAGEERRASARLGTVLDEPSIWTTTRKLKELLKVLMTPGQLMAARKAYVKEFGEC